MHNNNKRFKARKFANNKQACLKSNENIETVAISLFRFDLTVFWLIDA